MDGSGPVASEVYARFGLVRQRIAAIAPTPLNVKKLNQKSREAMSNMEQDRWSRVKGRLRSSVGEDVYSSWFARMDLESVQQESVQLSVPTRFLKSWIQAHYAERVLTCWQ